ncbi:MAG: hypothetical protein QOI42_174 [Frankiaceae bacterium]|nr:hypothetical protein [Frankiaceae bacterium]
MLLALGRPPALVGLVLGFLAGVFLVGVVQTRMARTRGARASLGRFVDPFGAIAAALGGVGWGLPPEVGRWRRGPARRRAIALLLAAPITHLVLAAIGFAALIALGDRLYSAVDPRVVLYGVPASSGLSFFGLTVLGFATVNLTMALLHVIPLPPMAAGRILLLVAPQTPGWQKAAYYLEDNNWGVGILLALSLPIFSGAAVSGALTAAIARPILEQVAGTGSG